MKRLQRWMFCGLSAITLLAALAQWSGVRNAKLGATPAVRPVMPASARWMA